MSITKERVLKALSTVEDPDLKKDLVTLGMIQDVVIDGIKIKFSVVLTTPACPLKELIKNNCVEALAKEFGQVELDIFMTSNVTTARDNAPLIPKVKNIIAIASGKGGVGKSTCSANLAVALANTGAKVGLIDADISGPSIPTMFNVEAEQPAVKQENGKNIIIPIEQYGVKLIGLLTDRPASGHFRYTPYHGADHTGDRCGDRHHSPEGSHRRCYQRAYDVPAASN